MKLPETEIPIRRAGTRFIAKVPDDIKEPGLIEFMGFKILIDKSGNGLPRFVNIETGECVIIKTVP